MERALAALASEQADETHAASAHADSAFANAGRRPTRSRDAGGKLASRAANAESAREAAAGAREAAMTARAIHSATDAQRLVAVEAASLAAERMDARDATLVAASDALERARVDASLVADARAAAKLLRDADAVAARTSDLGLAQREVDGAARRFDAAAQAQLAELEAVETAVAEAERLEREAKIAEAKIFDADVASAQCDVSRDEARRGFFAALTSASEARQRAEPRRERYAGSLSRTYATKLALLKARHAAERALRSRGAAEALADARRLELDTAAKSLEMARAIAASAASAAAKAEADVLEAAELVRLEEVTAHREAEEAATREKAEAKRLEGKRLEEEWALAAGLAEAQAAAEEATAAEVAEEVERARTRVGALGASLEAAAASPNDAGGDVVLSEALDAAKARESSAAAKYEAARAFAEELAAKEAEARAARAAEAERVRLADAQAAARRNRADAAGEEARRLAREWGRVGPDDPARVANNAVPRPPRGGDRGTEEEAPRNISEWFQ